MNSPTFELSESVHRLPGFVVCVQPYKKDSPSSGLFRVKVYNEHGMAQRNGTGIFPRAVMNRFPLLPLEPVWPTRWREKWRLVPTFADCACK
jgi:uncharacterized protein YbbK (DUF523 family)